MIHKYIIIIKSFFKDITRKKNNLYERYLYGLYNQESSGYSD
jgi:hypothetical protein